MIIFIENMQKLRVSNTASCKNIRFELQLKRSKRSFITHITYLNSQLLLLYIVQSYFGHYGNMWSGCSITFAPYIHFQLKIKCIASVAHRRHDTSSVLVLAARTYCAACLPNVRSRVGTMIATQGRCTWATARLPNARHRMFDDQINLPTK